MKRSQTLRIVWGGAAINQYPQIVLGGGGEGGGDPYTNQHPTLYPFYDVLNSQAAKMLGSMLYVR